jgi:MFS transporter, YNFM family, putative membrane transport protein
MALDFRPLAIATAGFTAFVNLYSPQALLPELSHEFGVGAGEISALITASSAAIALTAPFTGALADVLGRKRLITAAAFAIVVPTLIMAWAWTVPQLVVLRFVQGLLLPPIFTVAVAYVGDEWPPVEVARITGLFVSGSSVGGFCGRFATGAVADLLGWRASFGAVALITLVGAIIVTIALPRERRFVRSGGFAASAKQMIAHLGNWRLLAIYAVGFGVLFNFIATFTYVSFRRRLLITSRRRCSARYSPPISPEALRCRGSGVPLSCSAAATLCSASSHCGSPVPSCCWRRRCPRSL